MPGHLDGCQRRVGYSPEVAGVVVGDDIQITINAELVRQPEPSKGG